MELRVVVFGGRLSGKTSLINAVFGKELFLNKKRTAQCKKVWDNLYGRDLTLVDTPGWWKHYSLSDIPHFLKHELVRGVSLCDPGPHAVLVVIEIDVPFTEKHRKVIEDHLGLLGAQIWTQALVVFTRGHALRDRTIEEHIETEGKPLQWVIERCGNRYHVFDSADIDTSQVTKLLEKIEDTVRRNNGSYFKIEAEKLEEAHDWRKTVTAKAESRVLKLQQQRTNLNKEELRITLLGWVISGKSSAGNVILNRNEFLTGQSTLKCVTAHGEVDRRPVTVLDTPSWFKYFPSQYTPESIKSEILKSVGEAVTFLLLVIPADTSFKEEQRKVIQENMRLLGEQVWRNTIVLFTSGDILGDLTIEEHIESEGEALQWVIEKCGNRYHVFNNEDRENRVQVTELLQKIDEMMARNSTFQLNTETFNEINARPEVDTQADTRDLQDIVRLVDEEWRRRDKELLNRFSQFIAGKADKSTDVPSESREMSSKTQMQGHSDEKVSEIQSCSQEKEKRTLNLKDHVKEKLDREWSRREEAIMARFQEILSELGCEPQVLGEEFKRRENQFLNRVSETIAEFPRRADRSMDFPPEISEASSRTLTEDHRDEEVSQTVSHNKSTLPLKDNMKEMLDREWTRREEALMGRVLEMLSELRCVPREREKAGEREMERIQEQEAPDKSTLPLKDNIKEMLDREWSRREEALMRRVLEMMSELRCDALSEHCEHENERSIQKVSQWFERWSEGYTSASGNSVSDT